MSSSAIFVSNSQELREAFLNARGGETIYLEKSAEPYNLKVNAPYQMSGTFSAPVTLASADPNDPAVIGNIDLKGVRNVAFEGLTFAPASGTALKIYDSAGISVTGSRFEGPAKGYWDADTGPGGTAFHAQGVDGLEFSGNTVSRFAFGLYLFDVSDAAVTDNLVTEIQSDGIRMAQVQRLEISGNEMRDWLGVDNGINHSDFIQLWSTNTTEPSRDLKITDNVLIGSDDFSNQSIFLGNELARGNAAFIYENLEIRGNVIYNAHWNAIWVASARDVDIADNVLIENWRASGSSSSEPWIRLVDRTSDASVTGNVVSKITVDQGVDASLAANIALDYADPSHPRYLRTWLAEQDGWRDDPRLQLLLERTGLDLDGTRSQIAWGGAPAVVQDELTR